MICFDKDKTAVASMIEVEGTIATTTEEIWNHYCWAPPGEHWDIVDGQFVAYTPVEQMLSREDAIQRIDDLKIELKDTDWVSAKLVEYVGTDEYTEMVAKYADVLAQRKEWRAEINELQEKYNLE